MCSFPCMQVSKVNCNYMKITVHTLNLQVKKIEPLFSTFLPRFISPANIQEKFLSKKNIITETTISMQNEDEESPKAARLMQIIYDCKRFVFVFNLKTKGQLNMNFFSFHTFPASQEDFARLFGDFLSPSSFL